MSGFEEGGQRVVSVCVPAYMAEDYIAACIESVLAQTHHRWELLILDNNSSDRTGEIAGSYNDPRITVHTNQTTLSLADNWNAVVALATADYVKLLCADDVLRSECLSEELAVLTADGSVALVAGRRHFIDSTGEVVLRNRGLRRLTGRHEAHPTVQAVVRSGINPIGCSSAMMFRRDAFIQAGGFEPQWHHTLDLDMAIRLLEHGAFHGIDRPLSLFRISPTSASSTLAGLGDQHRSWLRHVAASQRWGIGKYSLARGLILSKIESVRKLLLFAAVNSSHRGVRQIPGIVLPGDNDYDDVAHDAPGRDDTDRDGRCGVARR